ncbi:aldo/keto reductase [Ohessyouella blattaphilus]|uniref:Aldo/keto reductase n=1 Tax=Ohessyouella blattaphilus TaxID=2949333 RepID=A0ABT1EHW2_9FIRM|nr:aldo/keto reductase [Ohessyouella blattaphilus]MCP1110291.1 aldo/keto reductase [Ohessyouella blattaphilus]MCR8563685.1 aldo/keto reductase [Ohessyouella blattaphilus]
MKKQPFGTTKLQLSNICYGTGNFGEKLTKEQAFYNLDMYLDAGGNFIDSANVYCRWVPGLTNSSEQYLGEWLKSRNAYDKVVIATKGGHYDFESPEISRVNPRDVRKDLEESLQTLGLERIALYWLHRDDLETPIEDIIEMMEDFVKEGKIRYYGASNYTKARMNQAVNYAEEKGLQGFSAVSNQWSAVKVNPGGNLNSDPTLVMMDEDYYQWHKAHQMPLVPYSAGGHGYFQKRFLKEAISPAMKKAYDNESNEELLRKFSLLSQETGVNVHAVSLAWLLQQPFPVFPIAAITKPTQLEDFLVASEFSFPADFNNM